MPNAPASLSINWSGVTVGIGSPTAWLAANPGSAFEAGDGYIDATSSAAPMWWGVYPSFLSSPVPFLGPEGPAGPPGPGGGGPSTLAFASLLTPFSAGASWATALSKSYTLSSPSNGVLIRATGVIASNTSGQAAYLRLLRDSTPVGLGQAADQRTRASSGFNCDINYDCCPFAIDWVDEPGDTASHTYSLQLSAQPNGSATAYVGQRGDDTDAIYYARFPTMLSLQEVIPQ